MKWNQKDMGKAPHRGQGICTTVQDTCPRPLGFTQNKLTLVLKSNPGTYERRCNQPKGQGAFFIRRLELNWIVH